MFEDNFSFTGFADQLFSVEGKKKPMKIMSLDNEPKNLEIERRRRTKSDGILIDGIEKLEGSPPNIPEEGKGSAKNNAGECDLS